MTGIDESLLFRTLQPDMTRDGPTHPVPNDNNPTNALQNGQTWDVQPKPLRFDQRNLMSQKLTISNRFQRPQTFQIDSNFRHLFSMSSNSGRIEPGRDYTIDISLKQNVYVPADVMLTVYIESDSVNVPVKVNSFYPPY